MVQFIETVLGATEGSAAAWSGVVVADVLFAVDEALSRLDTLDVAFDASVEVAAIVEVAIPSLCAITLLAINVKANTNTNATESERRAALLMREKTDICQNYITRDHCSLSAC